MPCPSSGTLSRNPVPPNRSGRSSRREKEPRRGPPALTPPPASSSRLRQRPAPAGSRGWLDASLYRHRPVEPHSAHTAASSCSQRGSEQGQVLPHRGQICTCGSRSIPGFKQPPRGGAWGGGRSGSRGPHCRDQVRAAQGLHPGRIGLKIPALGLHQVMA